MRGADPQAAYRVLHRCAALGLLTLAAGPRGVRVALA